MRACHSAPCARARDPRATAPPYALRAPPACGKASLPSSLLLTHVTVTEARFSPSDIRVVELLLSLIQRTFHYKLSYGTLPYTSQVRLTLLHASMRFYF
jgi:hypothetical protein